MYHLLHENKSISSDMHYCGDSIVCEYDGFIEIFDEKTKNRIDINERFAIENANTAEYLLVSTRNKIIKISISNFYVETLVDFPQVQRRQIKFVNNTDVICREKDNDKWFLRCVSLASELVRWEVENDTTFTVEVVGDFVLLTDSENDETLTCRSLKTGGVLWQADVAEFGNWLDYDGKTTVKGKVKNVYPIDEDLVVVEVVRSYLVAFRISTGEQLWHHNGPYTTFYNVSLCNNTFHIFSDYYYKLDAQTGKVLRREEFTPLLKQAGIRQSFLTQPAVNEKYIAIASHYDSAILLINRADFTVAQRIDLEGCPNGIPLTNTPRFHGNRLFQLDGDGTLHVFEED
jgi:outer membrane protein assembly factor BamB